jgi:hypothetical protein
MILSEGIVLSPGTPGAVYLTKAGVNPIIRRNLEDFDLCI